MSPQGVKVFPGCRRLSNPKFQGMGMAANPKYALRKGVGFNPAPAPGKSKCTGRIQTGVMTQQNICLLPNFWLMERVFHHEASVGPPGKLLWLILHGSFCNDLWIFAPGEFPEILKSDKLKEPETLSGFFWILHLIEFYPGLSQNVTER